MWRVSVFACALGVLACTTQEALVTEVDLDTIGYLEPRITMPVGARPIEDYDRYYAMDRIDDRNIVRGIFLLRSSFGGIDRPGTEAVAPGIYRGASTLDLPMIADGGCSVVSFFFDAESLQFVQIATTEDGATAPAVCNGYA
jgi:hypothetical protein